MSNTMSWARTLPFHTIWIASISLPCALHFAFILQQLSLISAASHSLLCIMLPPQLCPRHMNYLVKSCFPYVYIDTHGMVVYLSDTNNLLLLVTADSPLKADPLTRFTSTSTLTYLPITVLGQIPPPSVVAVWQSDYSDFRCWAARFTLIGSAHVPRSMPTPAESILHILH